MSALEAKRRDMPRQLCMIKHELMQLGLYRTARMVEIATQEIGWELQNEPTPEYQRKRQQETLTP